MTMKGGIDVEAIIQRHCVFSPKIVVLWNATDETNPSMIPNAVHICHIIVKAPRIFLGADSAA
jgi:hypothetical protein